MKFTWLSSESPFIAADIFEGLFGPLRRNIRYMSLRIQQKKKKIGSAVAQCLTRDQRAAGSSLTASLRCVLEQEY